MKITMSTGSQDPVEGSIFLVKIILANFSIKNDANKKGDPTFNLVAI